MTEPHISIIGCGFSGIAMGIKLKMAGHNNFTIFDKSAGVGGTWFENTYPDCGCDIPSGLYSFSFENYPDWDRVWSKQPQILKYQQHCVNKYGLMPHIKLNSMMRACDWDEKSATWTLQIEDVGKHGDADADEGRGGSVYKVTSTYVVMAQGTLHVPQFPNVSGVNVQNGESCFKGDSFHSAEWNHSVDLSGKRVGVIGSGASAIQLVPEVAKVAKELHVFQRTAPYVQYKTDFALPGFVKYIFRYVPFAMTVFRYSLYIATEIRFPALFSNSWMSKWIKWDNIRYLKQVVKDPKMQEKLIPPYELGCKRMLFSSFWYPALIKPNVHVVQDRIVGVSEEGIVVDPKTTGTTGSQEAQSSSSAASSTKVIDLDVIVYSTGFQYTRVNAPRKHQFDVTGQRGTSLTKWFQEGPKCMLGITAPDFPNLFFVYGPNSNLGHNSIIFMIECQVNYIMKLLAMAKKNPSWKYVQVLKECVDDYYETHVRKALIGKVWDSCTSWYRWPVKDPSTGAVTLTGNVYSLWPSSTLWYYWMTLWPVKSHFRDSF